MIPTNVKTGLTALALAGGLAACQSAGGDSLAAAGAGENASAVAGVATPSAPRISNPTNGGSAFVNVAGR